jgi:cobyrinic acid a,c-diamide synthase
MTQARHAFLISAAHKSSGKTTLSIGLSAALAARGLVVQPFKKGPDYIDPMWLGEAAGQPCRNLDLHLSGVAGVHAAWHAHGDAAEVCLVEGNKGLYDGLALDGSDSNAALAVALDVPVILVIDCRGMTRGIAPLVLGYQAFDPKVRIAGIILNRVGGPRHEGKLRDVLAHYTQAPVLGAIPETPELAILERHLGLMPSNEATDADDRIATLGRIVERHVQLDRLLELTTRIVPPQDDSVVSLCAHRNLRDRESSRPRRGAERSPLRVGIARDRAFGFYYPDDLDAFEAAGATLVPFDTLRDAVLPEIDALFIGGGFPETLAASLESNAALRADIRRAIEAGLPTYAECGGLMYLSRAITWNGRRHEMVGVIPAETVMTPRPVGRGYVEIEATAEHPWWPAGTRVRAHEFHYSRIDGLPEGMTFGWTVRRGAGIAKGCDGIRLHNLFASYAHLRGLPGLDWAASFVDFARRVRAARPARAAAGT